MSEDRKQSAGEPFSLAGIRILAAYRRGLGAGDITDGPCVNNMWQMRFLNCTEFWDINRLETASVVTLDGTFWVVYIHGVRSGSPFPTREEGEAYASFMLRIMS